MKRVSDIDQFRTMSTRVRAAVQVTPAIILVGWFSIARSLGLSEFIFAALDVVLAGVILIGYRFTFRKLGYRFTFIKRGEPH